MDQLLNDDYDLDDLEDYEWIDLDKLKNHTIKYANELSIADLEKLILTLKHYYYNTDEPLVEDETFDLIEEVLKNRDPQNKILKMVGIKAPKKGAVKLPYLMPSQNKAKADTGEIQKWFAKNSGPYVVSDKIDGMSMLLTIKNNNIKLYSRGKSIEGTDLTQFVPYLDLISTNNIYDNFNSKNEIAVRGELTMLKSVWNRDYADKFPKARNWISGKLKIKIITDDAIKNLKKIRLVCFSVLEPKMTPLEQLKFLKDHNFHVVPHKVYSNTNATSLTEATLKKHLEESNTKGLYQVDGLVISQNIYEEATKENPDASIAYKMSLGGEAMTTVKEVIWQASKDRRLKPVVIVENIFLSGANIDRATAHNAKFVVDNKIGPGAKIILIRSGEVIPYIKDIIQPANEPQLPKEKYEWNETGVDIMLTNVTRDVQTQRLVHMVKVLEIDNLGPGTIEKLVALDYTEPEDILNIKLTELQKVPSLGVNADKIFSNLTKLKNNENNKLTIDKLMYSVNYMFSEGGIGNKTFQLILEHIPDLLTRVNRNNTSLYNDLLTIKGIQDKTAQKLLSGLSDFKQFLKKIPTYKVIIDPSEVKSRSKSESSSQPSSSATAISAFKGMRAIFSGFRNKELEELITSSGGSIGDNINKSHKYQVLIVKDKNNITNKITTAQDLNIPIYEIDEFNKKYL